MSEQEEKPLDFKAEFEAWQRQTWACWQKLREEGYSDDEISEMLWGRELLERWKKLSV